MFGMSGRQTRCACYAILAVMVAVDPWMSLGPMLFLLLMDFMGS
jgi:hypothetical protein